MANPLPITVERTCHIYEEIDFNPDAVNGRTKSDTRQSPKTIKNALRLDNGLEKSQEVSGSLSHCRQSSSPANVVKGDSSPVSGNPDSELSSGDKSPYPKNQHVGAQKFYANDQYRSLETQLQHGQRKSTSARRKGINKHQDIGNMGEYEFEVSI